MTTPVFEKCDEMKALVKKLLSERSDLFAKVSEETIDCVLRTDKPAPASSKDTLKIKGIRGPLTALTNTRYIIHGYASVWDTIPSDKQIAYIAFMLKHIASPTEEEKAKLIEKGETWEWGKIEKPDFTSFKSFARVYGIDWETETKVPNPLTDTSIVI